MMAGKNAGGIPAIGLFLILIAALLLFLSGCASSSKYVPCCKRDGVYNITMSPQQLLANPNCTLSDGGFYGYCDPASIANGTVKCLPSAAQCNKPTVEACSKIIGCVWDSATGACRGALCGDMKTNETCTNAKCTWTASSACAPANDAAYVQMSICVDSAPPRCINDKCSVMLCGYKKLVPAPPPSSSDWDSRCNGLGQADCTAAGCTWAGSSCEMQPAPVGQSEALNLFKASCTFKKMNAQTYNSVKNSRGALWANAFRFGVGSTFSEYEQSRFFFPLSDRFCSGTVSPYAKDRFVVYQGAKTTWCQGVQNYYRCTENNQNFTILGSADGLTGCTAYCKNTANCVLVAPPPAASYGCTESTFVYTDAKKCKSECGIVMNPKSCPVSQSAYPFLESDSKYKMSQSGWSLDYNAYKQRLESEYTMTGSKLFDYECESPSDCMSGYCDTSFHVRGLCVDADDETKRIDCGCRVMRDDDGIKLNCSNALTKSDGVSKYTVYRSTIAANVKGRSQGTWDAYYEGYERVEFFNPYRAYSGLGRDNEIEDVSDGILISSGSGGYRGNIGSMDNITYRFYVKYDAAEGPPKLFKNCGIPRTSKKSLYSAYGGGNSVCVYGTCNLPPPAADGMGPGPKKFCVYDFDKSDPRCCWGCSRYHTHMTGLLPTNAAGTCVQYLDSDGKWQGTGDQGCIHCGFNIYCYYYTGTNTGEGDFWVYELSFDGENDRLGNCMLIGKRPPFIAAKDIGWCEGCTFSTLAQQEVADSTLTSTMSLEIQKRMALYLRANVMPVIDAQATAPFYYERSYDVCVEWSQTMWGSVYCSEYDTRYDRTTNYSMLDLCKGNSSGAALYIVSNLLQISDHSTPSQSNSKGAAMDVDDPATDTNFVDYVNYPGIGNAVHSDIYYYLNGYSSALWKNQLLKARCPNQPLTGIFLEGYPDLASTAGASNMMALVGNESSPGKLHRFFYKMSMPTVFKEASLSARIASGQPDHYPDGIDLLAQEWYPTCGAGPAGATDLEKVQIELEGRMNFSRMLLGNFSKPSLITKFHFPAGSACNQQVFMEYVLRHRGDMVDAGILGIIYDHYSVGDGLLEDPVSGRASTPFCAVQNHSKQVMGLLTHTYGQKVVAENKTCFCAPCDATAYSMGVCDIKMKNVNGAVPADQAKVPYAWCNDAQLCQMPDAAYRNYSNYFCPSMCANYSACKPCSGMVSAQASCRISTTYATYKTLKGYPDLDQKYWNIIAALPQQDKCCVEKVVANDTIRFTYMKKQSTTQRSELLQFPRRGETGIDCGRVPDTSFLTYCGIDVPINNEETTCFRSN